MAVAIPAVLLLASLVGLATGRWEALLVPVTAVPALLLLLGPEAGAFAGLAAAGLAAGIQLHRVVAENSVPRAG
jgi:hypothetical protein